MHSHARVSKRSGAAPRAPRRLTLGSRSRALWTRRSASAWPARPAPLWTSGSTPQLRGRPALRADRGSGRRDRRPRAAGAARPAPARWSWARRSSRTPPLPRAVGRAGRGGEGAGAGPRRLREARRRPLRRLVQIYKGSEPDYLTSPSAPTTSTSCRATPPTSTRSTTPTSGSPSRSRPSATRPPHATSGSPASRQEIDEQAQRLDAAHDEFAAAGPTPSSGSPRLARGARRRAVGSLRGRERSPSWSAAARAPRGRLLRGGPYSIPTYIVMCESGGNYRALNAVQRGRRRVPDHPLDLAGVRRPGPPAPGLQGRAGPDRGDDLGELGPERLVLRLSDFGANFRSRCCGKPCRACGLLLMCAALPAHNVDR